MAADEQMASSRREVHVKVPPSVFEGSDTSAFWGYLFLGNISSKEMS